MIEPNDLSAPAPNRVGEILAATRGPERDAGGGASTVKRYIVTFTTTSINEIHRTQFPTREDDPDGGVDRHSAVFATISEVDKPVGGTPDFPFVGNASLAVRNVAPADDGVVAY